MEEPNDPQLELLAKIHNQLVDLTKLIAEVEMSKTTSQALKTQLLQLSNSAQHVGNAARPGSVPARQQKVIAPTNINIEPGEASER